MKLKLLVKQSQIAGGWISNTFKWYSRKYYSKKAILQRRVNWNVKVHLNKTLGLFFAWTKGKVKMLVSVMSESFVTTWTVACQAPLSIEFSRQECWSGLPFPSPGDLPNAGVKAGSPALQADSLLSEPQGKPWEKGGRTKPFLGKAACYRRQSARGTSSKTLGQLQKNYYYVLFQAVKNL